VSQDKTLTEVKKPTSSSLPRKKKKSTIPSPHTDILHHADFCSQTRHPVTPSASRLVFTEQVRRVIHFWECVGSKNGSDSWSSKQKDQHWKSYKVNAKYTCFQFSSKGCI